MKLAEKDDAIGGNGQVLRRFPIGAEVHADGVHFRVWAPKRKSVAVVVRQGARKGEAFRKSPSDQILELKPEADGYFFGSADSWGAGALYGFSLDSDERLQPDPASRFQPFGPAGWSQVVDPGAFRWTDADWRGPMATGQVIYEMHIGTFTSEGTWAAAVAQLPLLRDFGVTILEVMPVADFPGEFGWGYDGVCMFAPTRLYGVPDDFRRFVDRAHALGLSVILDVVYNHFGNIDNYVREFCDDYRSTKYENEWADAINFDGDRSAGVREFFIANARYWVEEFHLDGFRFDATQAIHDASPTHIMADISQAARDAACGRRLFLVAENEPQDVRTLRPVSDNGFDLDAVWNDDFHHAARVRLTGKNPAYYSDYLGGAAEFASMFRSSFLYQGQRSQWQGKPRGTITHGFPARRFVNFLQNHDQVANSADGRRLHELSSPGRFRAMTALWLLSPQTPLFFQGQEFAASSPFLFFADYTGEIAEAVRNGRAKFLSQFPSLAPAKVAAGLPDPSDVAAFLRCKLRPEERSQHRHAYDLHRDLLHLRASDPVFARAEADGWETTTLSPDCLAARYYDGAGDDRLLIVNFGVDLHLSPSPCPLFALPRDVRWTTLWHSDEFAYGGTGPCPVEGEDGWRLPGEAAVVLRASPSVPQSD